MSPFFSVLVPTYGRASVLPRALESVLSQTFRDFEVLVVDDASPDQTPFVVARFSDPRLRHVRLERNQGVAGARNRGIREARGEVVALLDDDDEYRPQFLERTAEVFAAQPAVSFTWTGVRWLRDRAGDSPEIVREGVWAPSFPDRESAYEAFLANRRVGTNCGLAVRRSVLVDVGGFDEGFRGGAEDTDLMVRLVREHDFTVIPQVLVDLHLHGGPSLRRVSREKAHDYERLMAKNEGALARNRSLKAGLLYKTGWLYCHAGDVERGLRFLRGATEVRPRFAKAWLARSLFGVLGDLGAPVHRFASSVLHRRGALSSPAERLDRG